MTEMKRVPNRISHRAEGDMFEEFSCSSDYERPTQTEMGDGLLPVHQM